MKKKKELPCRNTKLGTSGEEETAARRRLHETQKLKKEIELACRGKTRKPGNGGARERTAPRRLRRYLVFFFEIFRKSAPPCIYPLKSQGDRPLGIFLIFLLVFTRGDVGHVLVCVHGLVVQT